VRLISAVLMLLVSAQCAAALPVSCDVVRKKARGLSTAQVEQRARALGLSEKEVSEVLACLRERKT